MNLVHWRTRTWILLTISYTALIAVWWFIGSYLIPDCDDYGSYNKYCHYEYWEAFRLLPITLWWFGIGVLFGVWYLTRIARYRTARARPAQPSDHPFTIASEPAFAGSNHKRAARHLQHSRTSTWVLLAISFTALINAWRFAGLYIMGTGCGIMGGIHRHCTDEYVVAFQLLPLALWVLGIVVLFVAWLLTRIVRYWASRASAVTVED